MTNFNNFSPNMLKTFDECQQKFFFRYIQKLSVPQRSTIFEKGKKIHALANYYLKGEDIEKMEKALNEDEKKVWETLKASEYFKLDVINTEYNLSCKVGKYWVGGRLDAFMEEGKKERRSEGEQNYESVLLPSCPPALSSTSHLSPLTSHYYILDYKTGDIPKNAENDFQTIVYLLCADKFLKKKGGYNSLKFVYIGLKSGVEKEILLTESLEKQYEEKIVSTCEKINFAVSSGVFSKNDNACKFCEYSKICAR